MNSGKQGRWDRIAGLGLGLLCLADLAAGCYLAWVGARGIMYGDGPAEGAVVGVAVGGAALFLSAAIGAASIWRPDASPRSRLRRLLAFGVALLPLLPIMWLFRPDPWTLPKEPEVLCFEPAKREQMGEIGWSVDGRTRVGDRLFPSRPADFTFVVRGADGRAQKLHMDCSEPQRCRYRGGADDSVRAQLAHLPRCEQ